MCDHARGEQTGPLCAVYPIKCPTKSLTYEVSSSTRSNAAVRKRSALWRVFFCFSDNCSFGHTQRRRLIEEDSHLEFRQCVNTIKWPRSERTINQRRYRYPSRKLVALQQLLPYSGKFSYALSLIQNKNCENLNVQEIFVTLTYTPMTTIRDR